VNVLALGGWREVLRFANEFKVNGLFHNTKIVIVLDGDIKSNFYKKFGSPCRRIKKSLDNIAIKYRS